MNWVLLGLSFKWLPCIKEEIAENALIILLRATASLLMLSLSSLKLTQNWVSSAYEWQPMPILLRIWGLIQKALGNVSRAFTNNSVKVTATELFYSNSSVYIEIDNKDSK